MHIKKLNLSSSALSPSPIVISSRKYIDVSSYLDSLLRFTEENFSAAAKIEIPEQIYGTSPLSLEDSALFWKKLLSAVKGRHFITARAEVKSGILTLHITSTEEIDLEASDCIQLFKIAKSAGFKPMFENGEFTLRAEIQLAKSRTIYAGSFKRNEFYYALCKVFFE